MIDKNSPLPIYYQIQEWIRKKMDDGEWEPGDMLPSERIFAEQFNISRMTVRQAITELVNEGLLRREKGKGTFVAEKKLEQPLQGLTSFTEDMKARGFQPGNKLYEFRVTPPSRDVADALNMKKTDSVYELERVRLADNKPMALEMTSIHAGVVTNLSKDIAQSSLYNYIEQTLGLTIGHASQTLESALAGEKEAELLQIEAGDPILWISRKTHLQDGTPFEYVRSAYRGDRYKFSIHLPRSTRRH
ncbi:GntR family transcriptional regulator [Alteribacillus persepolensis]|uniref:GntR family transcriptional regulator n=1 Tax=Alteribacillus persepolensis TaxID=568899 RepID=A0A1G8B141_9BACI|nr:GntR family transcriptional regulator [Alteribacillus persepolensis]SDH26844.1 GntR family transcriptional regulator [Alteribacillus persepolensis]